MEPQNLKEVVIQRCSPWLVKDLQPQKLLRQLGDCFEEDDTQEVMAEKTDQARAQKLLYMLRKRNAVTKFWDAVRITQPHIAEMLNSELEKAEKKDVKQKQERSHSADLQEKIDSQEREKSELAKQVQLLKRKLEKQAAQRNPNVDELSLQHLAWLYRLLKELLSDAKQTHSAGDRHQDCPVCKNVQRDTGKVLSEELQSGFDDAHRIAEELSRVKKMIQDQDQKVKNAQRECEQYRRTHMGKIKELKEENGALKKEKKRNENIRKEIQEKTIQENIKLQVQLDEAHRDYNRLQEDIRKYKEQISCVMKEEQKSFSLSTYPRNLNREESGPRCEVREHEIKIRELSAQNNTLANELKELRVKCGTLHEALADQHKHCGTSVAKLSVKHEALDGRVKVLERKTIKTIGYKVTDEKPNEETFLTGNSGKMKRCKNVQESVVEGRRQSKPSARQDRNQTPIIRENSNKYASAWQFHENGWKTGIIRCEDQPLVIPQRNSKIGDCYRRKLRTFPIEVLGNPQKKLPLIFATTASVACGFSRPNGALLSGSLAFG